MAAHLNIVDETGLHLFIAKTRSNSTNKSTIIGLHTNWKLDGNFIRSKVSVALCARQECVIVPARYDSGRWLFCPSLVDFLDDSDVYFVGVDIHNCMEKVGMQCRNAVEIRGLAAHMFGRPQLAVLNVLDLAREVVAGLHVAKPDREAAEYYAIYAYAAYVVGERLISTKIAKPLAKALPKNKAMK